MNEPWLTQPDKVYEEKGGWEAYADYESWLLGQMTEEEQEDYLDNCNFQGRLYSIFCRLYIT